MVCDVFGDWLGCVGFCVKLLSGWDVRCSEGVGIDGCGELIGSSILSLKGWVTEVFIVIKVDLQSLLERVEDGSVLVVEVSLVSCVGGVCWV